MGLRRIGRERRQNAVCLDGLQSSILHYPSFNPHLRKPILFATNLDIVGTDRIVETVQRVMAQYVGFDGFCFAGYLHRRDQRCVIDATTTRVAHEAEIWRAHIRICLESMKSKLLKEVSTISFSFWAEVYTHGYADD